VSDPFSAPPLILVGAVLMFLALALIALVVSEWWEPAYRLAPVALVGAGLSLIACFGKLIYAALGTAFGWAS
jgi:hypothetical protein